MVGTGLVVDAAINPDAIGQIHFALRSCCLLNPWQAVADEFLFTQGWI
jgi:hypothetical protein